MKKIVTAGEVLLRLSVKGETLAETNNFNVCYGGSEANVAVALCGFNDRAVLLTALPENELGRAAENSVRKYGVGTSIVRGVGRMGLYFYEQGVSLRAGRIVYDRANSLFASTPASRYDLSVLDGADLLHLSGITPALGGNAQALVFRLLDGAKERGVPVSFDLNYRSNLWDAEAARACFLKILPYVDICIASSDGLDILGMENAGRDVALCASRAEELKARFSLKAAALTVRESVSASFNRLSGVLYTDGAHLSKRYDVEVTERVGGGDAFAAGLLHALLNGFGGDAAIEFASAAFAYKHTVSGDAMCVPASEIEAVTRGDVRVRR